MKKIILLLFTVLLITSCATNNEFVLNGKFVDDKMNGRTVYLRTKNNDTREYTIVDSVFIENNSFQIRHEIPKDSSEINYILIEGLLGNTIFVKERGNIEISFDSLGIPTIKGTKMNNLYQEYMTKKLSFEDESRKLIEEFGKKAEANEDLIPQLKEEFDKKNTDINNKLKDYIADFTAKNISNIVGKQIYIEKGMTFTKDQLSKIIPFVDEETKKIDWVQKIERRFYALQATEIGKHFINITGNNIEGKEISLSEYAGKGKYVLLNFWASWNTPSLKKIPELVKIYNKYKNKEFEIVGVSLDVNNKMWKSAVDNMNITWPQMSDLKGWNSELSAEYGFRSLPHMILIDKEGKIIDREFNTEELEAKLAELLK